MVGRGKTPRLGVLGGDSAEATRLASDLSQRFLRDTIVQFEYLPMIRATSILGSGNGSKDASKAIDALAAAAPYEQGTITNGSLNFALYPVYLRAEAHLAAHQGAAAAVEFQKILDDLGLVQNDVMGALAHLGLGRAYALESGLHLGGKNSVAKPLLKPDALAKARAAYQNFLALWKDADPDIPILRQAKAEYAKLK
jgi:eukaryotic-like serine/threonine-protein kinase